jgi:hypothetical protein
MNLFDFPWIAAVILIIFLLVLALREWTEGRVLPIISPERGIAFFHVGVLVVGAILLSYGTSLLYQHAQQLSEYVALYPGARYAPEREAFTDKGQWVFVTGDSVEKVASSYRTLGERLGYKVVHDHASTSDRLLFARGGTQIFVTIEDEGSARVLYYSEDGSVRLVPIR